MDQDEDAPLVVAARAGDARAFERLVAKYADRVYGIVAAHVGRDEAEDAALEVFVRIYRGLAGFEARAGMATWIFRIATNVALTRVRRRRSRPPAGRLDPEREPPSRAPGPDDALLREERRGAVRDAIAGLPERERSVVVLRALEGLPFEEVARVLGIPRPTAESRMARAKDRLRTALGRWLEPGGEERSGS